MNTTQIDELVDSSDEVLLYFIIAISLLLVHPRDTRELHNFLSSLPPYMLESYALKGIHHDWVKALCLTSPDHFEERFENIPLE